MFCLFYLSAWLMYVAGPLWAYDDDDDDSDDDDNDDGGDQRQTR